MTNKHCSRETGRGYPLWRLGQHRRRPVHTRKQRLKFSLVLRWIWQQLNQTTTRCLQAWALLTGCKYQYTIKRSTNTGKFCCFGSFNPNEQRFEQLANCARDGFNALWPMNWPEVGGGGGSIVLT